MKGTDYKRSPTIVFFHENAGSTSLYTLFF